MAKYSKSEKEEFLGEVNQFTNYLREKDLISYLLKSHLFLESTADNFLKSFFKKPKNIVNKSFSDKVDIMDSLGIFGDKEIEAIKKFNSLRNKAAHSYRKKVTGRDISNIGSGLNLPLSSTSSELEYFKGVQWIDLAIITAYLAGHIESVRQKSITYRQK